MPRVCYYKVIRDPPRHFTAADAGRICCYAIQGGATWAQIREESVKRGCLDPEPCDCEQTNAIITAAQEMVAVALAVLAIVYPALRLLRYSFEVYRVIRDQLGNDAAEAYLSSQQNAKALEDLSQEIEPWLEMQYNAETGVWENVPPAVDPIIIRP